MSNWSLPAVLAGLHDEIEGRLKRSRETLAHPVAKGDASEAIWIELFNSYLPKRYHTAKATVVDADGEFSQQMDVVIFDRQYSPFIFTFEGQNVIPAESVYAVFEAKQSINAEYIGYAKSKVASVRRLRRTSREIAYEQGLPKSVRKPFEIIGGFLSFESDWSPPLGAPLSNLLAVEESGQRLDLGCVAAHGVFARDSNGLVQFPPHTKPATYFLFELIARLQELGTVPMIDVRAYSRWLGVDE